MDKKASILTFHCVPNYGAVLQAYAMQEYLKGHYDHVDIVDYRPRSVTSAYRYLNFYSVFSLGVSLWSLPSFWRKCRKFKDFERKYLTLTPPEKMSADLLVLGSDQIWNSQITKGLDPVYFGQIPSEKKPKIISYAASIGKAQLDAAEQNYFTEALEKLDGISVREEEAKRLLTPLTQKPICVAADPTILAGAECFLPLIRPVKQEDYVLLYSLNGYQETADMGQKVARYFGLPLIELSGRRKGIGKKQHKILYSAGPEEFVSLLAGAKYVVTDSFHGTVFSLLFHKPFISIPHRTRNGRLRGLLEFCELQDRLATAFDTMLVSESPDWEKTDQKLADLRKQSEAFLREAENLCK